jgi:hypothetical protein
MLEDMPLASDDLTIEILKQIRDSVRASTDRLAAGLDATNSRLDGLDHVERGSATSASPWA